MTWLLNEFVVPLSVLIGKAGFLQPMWLALSRKETKFRPISVIRSCFMRLSKQIKPISYLKANAAAVLHDLAAGAEPLVITQNGEARAVIQDIAAFERTQETLALLKLLALGAQDIDAGRTEPAREVAARIKAKFAARA